MEVEVERKAHTRPSNAEGADLGEHIFQRKERIARESEHSYLKTYCNVKQGHEEEKE